MHGYRRALLKSRTSNRASASRINKSAAVTTVLLLGALTIATASNGGVRLRTDLSGSAITGMTPKGNAEFPMDDKGRTRFNVEVEKRQSARGHRSDGSDSARDEGDRTFAQHYHSGRLPGERGNGGEMELEAEHGAAVPDLSSGTFTIHVNNGGATILTGVLHKQAAQTRGSPPLRGWHLYGESIQ